MRRLFRASAPPVYCTPTGLYYTCNFRGQLICVNYSTRTTNVRVTQLESIPLGRLPPHDRDSYTLFRITKNCSVTELAQVITPALCYSIVKET